MVLADEGVRVAEHRRVVFAAGVSLTYAEGSEDTGPPPLDALDPLTDAPRHAKVVERAFTRLGYVAQFAGRTTDPARLVTGVKAAVSCGADVVVVHVVAHGRPTRSSGKLVVVGPDGRDLAEPVERWLEYVEDGRDEPRPVVLFILDMCVSGLAATLPWHQNLGPGQRRAWVLAATDSRSSAYDFRLSRALAEVMDQYTTGVLRVDPSVEFIDPRVIAREVDLHIARFNHAEGGIQHIEVNRAPWTDRIEELPFFPNPAFDTTAVRVAGVDEALRPFIDEALDEQHFATRAAGTAPGAGLAPRGYFQGRAAELRACAAWLEGDDDADLRVVTGKPGVGKSALIGALVCAAHPELRSRYRHVWGHLPAKPAENPRLIAVHARKLGRDQIADSIARQLGSAVAERPSEGWTARDLVALATAGQDPRPCSIIIDALDEAQRPIDVVTGLLLPLADARRPDGGPAVRLLIGARHEQRFTALLNRAAENHGLLDLDTADADRRTEVLEAYVEELLADAAWYRTVDGRPAARAFARAAAKALAARPLEWGEFLVVGLYTQTLIGRPPLRDAEEAAAVGRAVPGDLDQLLAHDLEHMTSWSTGAVLTAVAFAEGRGIPERVIARVSSAFDLADASTPLPIEQIRTCLEKSRFYLRRDIDVDGSTLYRLFHESLAEALRWRPYRPDGSRVEPESEHDRGGTETSALFSGQVLARLLETVPTDLDGRRRWVDAEPYLLENLARHAVMAGRLDELVQDPEFLVHCVPQALVRELPDVDSAEARAIASIYRAGYPRHSAPGTTFQDRRLLLAIEAARYGRADLANQFGRPLTWTPRWATGSGVTPTHIHTLFTGDSRVTAVAIGHLENAAITATGTDGGAVHIWDLRSGQRLHSLTGHRGAIASIAISAVDGVPIAITGSNDGSTRIWDLHSMQLLHILSHGSGIGRLIDLAVGVVDGTPTAFTNSYAPDGIFPDEHHPEIRGWDLRTGYTLRQKIGNRQNSSIALGELDGEPIAVTDTENSAQLWSLRDGRKLRSMTMPPMIGYPPPPKRPIVIGDLAGRTVAFIGDQHGAVHSWDLRTGQELRTLTGHERPVAAIALSGPADTPLVITGDADGTVLVRDSGTGERLHSVRGHGAKVCAIAVGELDGKLIAVSGNSDGTAHVWDPCAEKRSTVGAERAFRVALGELEGRPIAVTSNGTGDDGDGGFLNVWDLHDGALLQTITERGSRLISAITVGTVNTADGANRATLAVTGDTAGGLGVWDVGIGQQLHALRGHDECVTAVALAQWHGTPIAVTGSVGGHAVVWDLRTAQQLCELTRGTDGVFAVALGELDSTPITVTADGSGDLSISDLRTGSRMCVLRGNGECITAVALGELDSTLIAVTGTTRGVLQVWDLHSQRRLRTLKGHTGRVTAVALGELNGTPIAVAGGTNSTARMWDLRTGSEIYVLPLPDACQDLGLAPTGLLTLVVGPDIVIMEPNPPGGARG